MMHSDDSGVVAKCRVVAQVRLRDGNLITRQQNVADREMAGCLSRLWATEENQL
jgi:hypothetical protein